MVPGYSSSECFDWFKLAWCAKKRGNMVKFMPQAVLEVLNGRKHIKIRKCVVFGDYVIFSNDQGLVDHVTRSGKFLRVNPLNPDFFPEAAVLTQVTGMRGFLEKFLVRSIWFQPSGDVHKRQRELFLSFVPKFLTPDAQRSIEKLGAELLEQRIKANGPGFDLFSTLQEVVAVLQLRFISDYELRDMTVEEYCHITNSAFGGMYAFKCPSPEMQSKLEDLCRDMLKNSGGNGLVAHMRRHASPDLPAEQREEELLHNLMAGLFLGQQSLANAIYWILLVLARDPELLKALRGKADIGLLPAIISEAMRLYPPSSPFLMPYLAMEDDDYNGLQMPKGTVVAMMPILQHLSKDVYEDPLSFHVGRFREVIETRRRWYEEPSLGCEDCLLQGVPASLLHACMIQNSKQTSSKSVMNCPVSGASGPRCPVTATAQLECHCPFGVGAATCPHAWLLHECDQ